MTQQPADFDRETIHVEINASDTPPPDQFKFVDITDTAGHL